MEELKEIKKQFDDLMAKAEEIVKKNEKGDERWRAKKSETYWCIGSDLEPHIDYDNYIQVDDIHFETGNYFRTKEEAEKVAQNFKDYLILWADAKGFEPKDASCESDYYYVYWDATFECLRAYNDGGNLSGVIYFETEEDVEASIAKHGDIWKRYLGVDK